MTPERMVRIEQDILAKNNAYAADNRRLLADRGVFALNLVSSPGSGKTTLLVRTIEALRAGCRWPSSKATSRPRSTPTGSARPARRPCR